MSELSENFESVETKEIYVNVLTIASIEPNIPIFQSDKKQNEESDPKDS